MIGDDYFITLKYGRVNVEDGVKIKYGKFTLREGIGICRGFNLCKTHIILIKKDNKIRISKGEDIPINLDIIKKIVRSDI